MKFKENLMDGIEPLNQKTESMIFADELPMALVEYVPNKLFITGTPTHMYLVDDWNAESVTVIIDNHPANTFKTQVYLLPGFNEQTFPFIAVSGKKHLRFVNVKTREHMPLVTNVFGAKAGNAGICFTKKKRGMYVHYASQMKDEEGHGRTLIHYSYIELKNDAIEWLTEHGRLPATSMTQYTEEVRRL